MKRKLKNLFSSSNLKRYLSVFLCALILVFGCQLFLPLEAEALAVIDDVVLLGIVLLVGLGVTFSTVDAAQNMSTSWLNQMSTDDKDILNKAAIAQHPIETGLFQLTANEWHRLYQSFCSSFPQYANLGHQTLNFSSEVQQQIMLAGLYSYLVAGNVLELGELPVGVDVDVTFQTSSSTIMRYVGLETLRNNYTVDQYITQDNSYQYLISSVPALDLVFVNTFFDYSNYTTYPGLNLYTVGDVDINGNITKYYDTSVSTQFHVLNQTPMYFKGEHVNLDSNQYGRYVLTTATYGNIASYLVTSGVLSRESPLINCDDWSWQKGAIDGLLLGKDVFDVGLDIEHAPAIDGFPSQVGDASDVDSYPDSIPLNIPTDITDETIGDLTADRVRDTTNTDVNPGDETGKDNTPPKIPHTTIPEILFKDKFPFCLPWDIYNLFVVFEDEAEAPRFEIPFKDEKLGIDETYVIDFSQFDNIAAIIRFFIGAGFVLALIMISRKLTGSE